jgi:hypothetical protein
MNSADDGVATSWLFAAVCAHRQREHAGSQLVCQDAERGQVLPVGGKHTLLVSGGTSSRTNIQQEQEQQQQQQKIYQQ